MIRSLGELNSYRNLFWLWILREIKVRYKQSLLGAAWAILQPLSLTLIFSIVFSYFVTIPSEGIPYPIFVYTAMLPWTFLATSLAFGVPSLVQNLNLVTKVYFPKEVLPLAAIAAAFFDFVVASSIFVLMILFYRQPISIVILWVPLLLIIQIALTIGVVLIGSALNVFYRDIRFVVPLVLQIWMYVSPVIYPVSAVPEKLLPIYMLNPMAGLIDSYRRVTLLGESPHMPYLGIASLISVLIFVIGYVFFKKKEWQFADLI